MFLDKLRKTLREHHLIERGDTVVVAVSGGADSVALLMGLFMLTEEFGYRLVVCHVDHGLRGEESRQDAEFVKELANRLGLPFELGEFQVAEIAQGTGQSIQVAAREVRYGFFERVMRAYDANKLAVAHHADDQAETILMRILRGTSASGLSGMEWMRKWKHGWIIRPMLHIWRHEIETFCKEQHISYRTDSSNLSTKYLRNKIRLELIPLIERAYNSNIKNRLLALGDIVRMEDDLLDQYATDWIDAHCTKEPGSRIRFSRTSFQGLHVALQRRVIKLILYYLSGQTASWEFIHMESIRRQLNGLQPNSQMQVANRFQLRCEYDQVQFSVQASTDCKQNLTYTVRLADSDAFAFGPFTIHTAVLERPNVGRTQSKWEAWVSLDEAIGNSIRFRTRLPGDTIRLFGNQGSAKIKKVMIDRKIPPSLRDQWPLLVVGEEIVWIPGMQRSGLYLLKPETQLALYLQVSLDPEQV
jgi:tRNA(Ile)-lysidine synthase